MLRNESQARDIRSSLTRRIWRDPASLLRASANAIHGPNWCTGCALNGGACTDPVPVGRKRRAFRVHLDQPSAAILDSALQARVRWLQCAWNPVHPIDSLE